MRRYLKHVRNQKGVTLVELLAVLVILAIIVAIAIPAVGNVINDTRDRAILADASVILAGAKLAYTNGDMEKNENVYEIDGEALKRYVDKDVQLTSNDKVTYDGSNTWKITYQRFKDIKNTEKFNIENNTLTEEQLNQLLD